MALDLPRFFLLHNHTAGRDARLYCTVETTVSRADSALTRQLTECPNKVLDSFKDETEDPRFWIPTNVKSIFNIQ